MGTIKRAWQFTKGAASLLARGRQDRQSELSVREQCGKLAKEAMYFLKTFWPKRCSSTPTIHPQPSE